MYESQFGLNDRPFAAAPAARRYFPAETIETARQTLARCIDRAEGVGLVVGPAGCGKSILCQVLAEQFRGRFLIALLASGRLETRRALLQAILFELRLPFRGMDEGELRLSLIDHLAAPEASSGGLLLLIDEAHSLPPRLLEEIHQFTNLVRNGQPRVRVVLAGNPILEEHLGSAKLESFNQRIAARCCLQSFKYEETLGYVRQAILSAGGEPDEIFAVESLDAIHRATDGVPRLVNQLCDHALLLAFTAGVRQLSAAAVEEAWADLQQLPTPWNAAPGVEERSSDIIEFGSLDEPAVAARIAPDTEPRLRTVAVDEASLFIGEPTQRIERIKEQLGTIDEQFQPAGTIGPEVELVFSSPEIDPFQEPFEEEEAIVDRFSAVAADPLAHAPIVCSAEGAELSALLAPHARDTKQSTKALGGAPRIVPSTPNQPVAAGDSAPLAKDIPPDADRLPIVLGIDQAFATTSIDSGTLMKADASLIAEPNKFAEHEYVPTEESPDDTLPITRSWLHPSEDPVMPEESGADDFEGQFVEAQPTIRMPQIAPAARSSPAIVDAASEPDLVEPPSATVQRRDLENAGLASAEQMVEALSVDDPKCEESGEVDLIVVEDDPIPPPPPKTNAVRRQEYRQLFARLRRG